jgi:ATP-dependent DNA helicase RecG
MSPRWEGVGQIDAREVLRLVASGEGPLLEFKPGDTRPSELASTLAALANAEGGTLVLGVAERCGQAMIEGVADAKLALDHLYTAAGLCSPRFPLLPPEHVNVDGRTVLVVTIPDDQDNAYSVDGRYQVRGGSYRRTLAGDEILSLLNRRGRFSYDATIVPGATRAHLDEQLVRAYAARFRSGKRMATDALLEARGLLAHPAGDPQAPAVPTVAGLLLLGTFPQQFLPQARVAVVRYAGPKMGERFLARELEGPLPAQLDAAEAWLATSMLHAVELQGLGRTDTDEYPLEAVREIILNALVHRDYSLGGDRVRIYLFGTDRLEVHSPGRLGGPMRLDNLLSLRWSRNRVLVQGLIALGIMEELGFGLDRVTEALAAESLPAPQFQETEGTFVVTLRGHGARLRAPTLPAHPTRPAIPLVAPTPADRQAWILDYLRTVGPLSPRAYAAALGISLDTAQRDMRELVRQGRVQAQGTTHDRRYTLTE